MVAYILESEILKIKENKILILVVLLYVRRGCPHQKQPVDINKIVKEFRPSMSK